MIEAASCTFVKSAEQTLAHSVRNVLQLWKDLLGTGPEILPVGGPERSVLTDCLEIAEAYLEDSKARVRNRLNSSIAIERFPAIDHQIRNVQLPAKRLLAENIDLLFDC